MKKLKLKNNTSFLLLAAMLLIPASTNAQDFSNEEFINNITGMMTEQVDQIYWDNAVGYKGRELKMPDIHQADIYEIPEEEDKKVVMAGINSGRFLWCGLDADAYFQRFMKLQKSSGKWNEYQMAYISLLHGTSQQFILVMMADVSNRTCMESTRIEMRQGYDKVMKEWKTALAAVEKSKKESAKKESPETITTSDEQKDDAQ